MKVLSVVGARPNFPKLAALNESFKPYPEIKHVIVHTGQHYDFTMSEQFFQDLKIPSPTHHLGIGSGSHAEQVGKTMMALEPVFLQERPDWIVVVGDVNATASSAMVAKKIGMRLAHVEAGLRSFDWGMPEEVNRVVTDRLSDLLLVSDPSGLDNLRAEGQEESRVHYVGNVMIDTLLRSVELAKGRPTLDEYGIEPGNYVIVTMHRPSNVDDPKKLVGWMNVLDNLAQTIPVVLPLHPRTKAKLDAAGFSPKSKNMKLGAQAGYLDMVGLLKNAKLVLTDSGGIQEETTALGIPCLTLRDNTERPITISEGTNTLVGSDPSKLAGFLDAAFNNPVSEKRPKYWDGHAADRITKILLENNDLAPRQK